jgi:cell division protein FtsN
MDFFNREDRFELHLDHGRLVLVAIGVLLVGALLFLLGMLVGKSFLSTSTDAAARIDAATAESVVARPAEPKAAEKKVKKPEYTFYENLGKPEGQGVEPLAAPRATPVAPITTKKANTTLIVPRAVGKTDAAKASEPVKAITAPRLIPPVPPAPKAAAPKKTAVKAAAKATAKKAVKPAELKRAPLNLATVFTIQVGSFQKRSMAENLVAQLMAKGIGSTVREVKLKGVLWYRVQVSEFATKNQARDYYAKKLKPKGIKGFILTR